jgi:hypothetical protein
MWEQAGVQRNYYVAYNSCHLAVVRMAQLVLYTYLVAICKGVINQTFLVDTMTELLHHK